MCGIVGIINTAGSSASYVQQIQTMNEVQHHRGPDDSGVWVSTCQNVHFGHKRLSILDLSHNASQPMLSGDGQYVLVFNGEIYNYQALRDECLQLGSIFRSNSDSEIIIESYRHWGEACVRRFRGMWSFLLYDMANQTIMISRDPFAIKPLYYSFYKGHFYFGSELKSLTRVSDFFKEEDRVTSQLFLEHGYLERQDWTFYKHIKRFPHAHYALLSLHKQQTTLNFIRYWHPNVAIDYSMTFKRAAATLKELLYDSVKLHLHSDVPIGSCLSGGIDSSAIVCIGSQLKQGTPFNTFTTHYPSHSELDETLWAKKVIDHTRAHAHFTEPTRALFQEHLNDLIHTQDEPFGSMSIFAQYCVFKKIAETSIKVVLDGQGADEMLAGYMGFIPSYFADLIKKRKYLSLVRELLSFKDMNIQWDAKHVLKNMIKKRFSRAARLNVPRPTQLGDEMDFRLNQLLLNFNSFEERLENLLSESNIPQLLRYEDRNSMRFSLESRVPFLDTELVDFVLSLPANFRIRHGYTKAVLREALKDVIPESIRKRRDKLGFPAPEKQWMKEGFGIDVSQNGGKEWRNFIHQRWQQLIIMT